MNNRQTTHKDNSIYAFCSVIHVLVGLLGNFYA